MTGPRPMPHRGLYAISGDGLAGETLMERCEAVLAGGAVMLQYRDKDSPSARRRADAEGLLRLTRRHGVPLVINDDLELAATIGADGVHLGQEDVDITTARRALGPRGIIGVSCYDRPDAAVAAQEAGADYVAFGRFFPSSSKPGASGAPIEVLSRARPRLRIPVVAIGGIREENGAALLAAGADLLAVIGALFEAPDPRRAATGFQRLFEQPSHPPGN
ncbi:MAG: thiamine phosphate synthase [Gammaproteobacteria bacterium]|nr:thiamine phosphate synthase [Gammaproteobacteria bacterium]